MSLQTQATAARVPEGERLGRAFVTGVLWSGASRWSAQLVTWISTFFVARLLTPEDYGIFGMAAVFLGIVTLLSEFGVGLTVVTLRDLSERQIAQLNALALLLGAAACVLTLLFAPAIAAFFSRPVLTNVLIAMAGTFILSGARNVPAALLQRDLHFRTLGAIEAAQALVGAAVMLGAAWMGLGYWAFVASRVSATAAWTAMALAVRRAAFAWPRTRTLGAALTFTRRQLVGNLAWYFYSNADFVVAGRLLGARDLGVYTIGWTVARIVPERLVHVVIRVSPAFLAALRDDLAKMRRWIYTLTEAVSVVTFPLLVGLALVADDAVPFVLGAQWEAAVPPMQLLLLYAAYDGVTQLLSRALTAVGDTQFTMRLGLALAVLMPAGFVAGAQWGPAGIAAAWLLIAPAARGALLLRARRKIGLSLRSYAASLWPAVSATIVMAIAVIAVRRTFDGSAVPIRLAAAVAGGAAAYVLACVVLHRPRLSAALDMGRRMLRS